MKKAVLLLTIFLGFISITQAQFEFKPDTTNILCIEQLKKAEMNFSSDNFILKIQNPFRNTEEQKKIIENYGVKVEMVRYYINNCYDYKIIELLNEKYQCDFINHTENEAKILARKPVKTSNDNYQKQRKLELITKEADSISNPLEYIKKESIGGKLDYSKMFKGYGAENAQYKAYLYSIALWSYSVEELGITRKKEKIKLWEEIHERKMTTDEKNVIKYGVKIKQ